MKNSNSHELEILTIHTMHILVYHPAHRYSLSLTSQSWLHAALLENIFFLTPLQAVLDRDKTESIGHCRNHCELLGGESHFYD